MSEEFSFRNWASEGMQGIRSKVHLPRGKMLPEGFYNHLQASRKEFLLAFRSLFDKAIEGVDKSQASRRKTNIKAE